MTLLDKYNYDLLCLLKPIYETENNEKRRSGEPLDMSETYKVIADTLSFVTSVNLSASNITHSPIKGSNGLREYLIHISSSACPIEPEHLDEKINAAIEAAFESDVSDLNFDYTGELTRDL